MPKPIESLLNSLWWALPLRRTKREEIKDFVFTRFAGFFIRTQAYRNWKTARFLSVIDPDAPLPEGIGEARFHITDKYNMDTLPAGPVHSLAVVVHVFYLDIFDELMAGFSTPANIRLKFYLTCPAEHAPAVRERMVRTGYEFECIETENRGRDILPFFTVAERVIADGFPVILKLHTKKSAHLKSGHVWRNDLYRKLTGGKAIAQAIGLFNQDPLIGIIGPEDHLVPMNLFYGNNAATLRSFCAIFHVPTQELLTMNFIAGSMFYVRVQAIFPLMNLNLQRDDFEEETGQLDGTLAHTMERLFAISAHVGNFKLVDTGYRTDLGEISVTLDHKFTR